uniref:Reverse transcriptase/retrotransposon-derived protein RNase H-like domain-containing protein n=1 Tax=Ananas comosus var. bracteatus TaxID=296719 RepID=A0A6V7PFY8_ANACO|nr:unnamed protein product [Ananas comosus var. bracteatus]
MCEPFAMVSELRSFLGLVNYYHCFIVGYSARAAPLANLLMKNHSWIWASQCAEAFEDLKRVVTEDLVLQLPDCSCTLEIHQECPIAQNNGAWHDASVRFQINSERLNPER